jgi:type II secretory pathway pseudopilin PulG
MISHSPDNSFAVGSTLIEAIIAIGVLAVAIPLVFGALAESGKSATAAQAETRGTWIIPACLDEIHASREGHPQYFTATMDGQTIPPVGELWALAFSADGKPVGKLSKLVYESGAKEIDGKPIRYIALMSSAAATVTSGTTRMINLRIAIEYPAAAKVARRGKIDFHTRIP